jgi:ATP-dependent helicase/nuclease subunit B
MPFAPDLLPDTLSASACEALRTCPYRFFALRLLSLREADELDDAVEKRDYGTWLHEVLHRFHESRPVPQSPEQDEARLREVAAESQQRMGLDDAAFLPFAATFERFVPRYVQWLHDRDAQGASWIDGERDLKAQPAEWSGVRMQGRIDRIDSVPGEQGPVTQLIDYKTGSAQALRNLVKTPLEDTQLAFYAALMAQQSEAGGEVSAMYLPLDDSDGIKPIEHPDVAVTAEALVREIGAELDRLRQGAAMPALGEGVACEFCEARGLCRRDHWEALP